MNLPPFSTCPIPQALGLLLICSLTPLALAELSLDDISPSQTRLLLAQASPGSAAAVSSQAVATQPEAPKRAEEAIPPQPATPAASPTSPATGKPRILDPRLDLTRPRNSQLNVSSEQTLSSGEISVTLPAGSYEQKLIIENPEDRRAIGETSLRPQQVGLGYIRYQSDVPLKVGGHERSGGLDVPIREEDNLPVRIWYRKMTEPDPVTKAFTFILPPVGLVAGLGAWSSGNVLIPDTPPTFTEARDYSLKTPKTAPDPNVIPQPSHVRPLRTPGETGASRMRSK